MMIFAALEQYHPRVMWNEAKMKPAKSGRPPKGRRADKEWLQATLHPMKQSGHSREIV
jgi:hypothetical protein